MFDTHPNLWQQHKKAGHQAVMLVNGLPAHPLRL
jgi:hypothetical protein